MTTTLMAINDSLYNSSYDINYPSHNETGIVCYESGECKINHTIRCVGDPTYCNLTEEEYRNLLYDYIFPTTPEWILIISHTIVFFMGLVGIFLLIWQQISEIFHQLSTFSKRQSTANF